MALSEFPLSQSSQRESAKRRPNERRLVRLLVVNAAIGVVAAVLFVMAIVIFDVSKIGTMVRDNPDAWFAIALLTVGLSGVWAALSAGTAVFLIPPDDDSRTGGYRFSPRRRAMRDQPALVTIPARSNSSRYGR